MKNDIRPVESLTDEEIAAFKRRDVETWLSRVTLALYQKFRERYGEFERRILTNKTIRELKVFIMDAVHLLRAAQQPTLTIV